MTAIDVDRLEQAKDRRLLRFLRRAVGFLDASGLTWAAFGSCAVFAHRGRLRRLTRDLDVMLPQADFERCAELARAAGIEAEREREHFVRMRHDIYQIHAVPEASQVFDYRTGEVLAPTTAGVPWGALERRELLFPIERQSVELPVVPAGIVLCISLTRPLNVNSLDDALGLLGAASFDAGDVEYYAERNTALRGLLRFQLDRVAGLVESMDAGPAVASALRRVRVIFDREGE